MVIRNRGGHLRLWIGLSIVALGVTGFILGFKLYDPARIVIWVISSVFAITGYLIAEPFITLSKAVARIGAAVAVTLGLILAFIAILPSNIPEDTMNSCLNDAQKQNDYASKKIAALFCETRFANIWMQASPVMFDGNRQLAVENFSRMTSIPGNDNFAETLESIVTTENDNLGLQVSSIYERWPNYENRAFALLGRVTGKNKLPTGDWVYQIGTVRSESQVIYVRLLRPYDWEPLPSKECETSMARVVPIARGVVPSAETGQPLDVIYGLGTEFLCLPSMTEADFKKMRDSMSPEERRQFDEYAE